MHLVGRLMETWGFGVKAVLELATSFCPPEGFLMLGVLSPVRTLKPGKVDMQPALGANQQGRLEGMAWLE